MKSWHCKVARDAGSVPTVDPCTTLTYIGNNVGPIVDYGERFRAGERISTRFVESAVNQIVDKRFDK
jgi:hypothetical protein